MNRKDESDEIYRDLELQQVIDDATHVACAVCVKQFRKIGWARSAVEQQVPRIMDRLRACNDALLEEVISDVTNVIRGGGSKDTVRVVAIAAFALAGIEVANDMERSRRAAAQ
jgi:hypothetical protein